MSEPPEIPVPEIRDYQKINQEVARLLQEGHPRIRLTGVERQRLLLSGLRGPWTAVIEVEGNPGPEFASYLDTPGVAVLCRGSTADGAGYGLQSGQVLVQGSAGDVAGGWMQGGSLTILGAVGHRAGLRQHGGLLVLGSSPGRLVADRQQGGVTLTALPVDALARLRGRPGTGGRTLSLADLATGTVVDNRLEAELEALARSWSLLLPPGAIPWPQTMAFGAGGRLVP
jgi:hypothetical protein